MERCARILATKKLQPNQRQYLLNAELSVTEADFIGISHKQFEVNNIKGNLIFTSQNGFKAFLEKKKSENFKDRNIFCVGQKTRDVIVSNGYNVIAFSDYAEELATTIINNYNKESFTFLSGSMRRDTLPEALKAAGIVLNEIEVYKTVLTPHKITSGADGILFFSPSGVTSYLKENSITNEACFCIGTTTAQALNGITENIIVANKPSIENVIIQCINYYKNY
ncbi:uroporphyrinogen-III synthase [Flavobacterium arcticum]|uniref:Uroporphyrinogen-III synthase n=1 Tax=Flavobacterium arcticum TaxID=1784713 RepID=A0A345HAZ7_9FLAO|nr:uroporphyrinogen-III synthase [Flavobacterium arcticum]AXG73757.1 uroporphyrinogen-III synthase [Flavobacterium arcticum]KAF2511709.1 uroporphyrinogen-III synthase [Flavobacterium arcticum]